MADNEIKEINVNNLRYHYFDDLINKNYVGFENIVTSENHTTFIWYLGYKIPYIVKNICIIFDKINRYIDDNDGTKKYLAIIKKVIKVSINNSDNYGGKELKTRINSNDEFSLEEALIIYSVVILFNDKNRYYPRVFLKKCMYNSAG